MVGLQEKQFVFAISRSTKTRKYKIRFRGALIQTLVFPKFSYTVIHGVPKPFKKYV